MGGRFIETQQTRNFLQIFRSPGMDFKEAIPLAYVAWRAGATRQPYIFLILLATILL